MTDPITKAGRWLVDRSRWDDGMRGFFVRINATAGPEDMRVHVLAIERESVAAERARIHAAVEGLTAHIVGGHEADCDTCIRWSDELQTDVDDRGIPCDLFDRGGVLNRAAVLAAIEGVTT